MRRRRAHKTLALAAAATLACSNAIAGPDLDAAFVALLSPPDGRRHPMADASGKLAVVVETPVFADARAMGLLPLGPGIATLRLWPRDLAHFEATHPDLRFSIWPPLHPVLDESARVNGTLAYRAALATSGSAVRG